MLTLAGIVAHAPQLGPKARDRVVDLVPFLQVKAELTADRPLQIALDLHKHCNLVPNTPEWAAAFDAPRAKEMIP